MLREPKGEVWMLIANRRLNQSAVTAAAGPKGLGLLASNRLITRRSPWRAASIAAETPSGSQ